MTTTLLNPPQIAAAPPRPQGETTISVREAGKCYRLYRKPQDRLKQALSLGRRRYFDEFWALRQVSFDVCRGETVGIVGRNGSGKSTLLQIVCGTLSPTQGEVETHGRVAALLELGAGFNPEFTGRENVLLNAALMGMPQDEIAARLPEILAFAEIGEHIDQPVKTYSTGMFVRLAFSVIAHLDADVLVIDEALAVGDAFFTQKCMRFLRRFKERGTILFVSHDTSAVVNLCDRAVWLDKGALRGIGPAKEICEDYLAALFEQQQGPHRLQAAKPGAARDLPKVDQRLKYINQTPLRNDIELCGLRLYESAAFGAGGAQIVHAELLDEQGSPLSWIVGGETVSLRVEARALAHIERPIMGFLVKDRLGQTLFSDNTCISHAHRPVRLMAGDSLEALFTFQMPILPVGDYSIALSVAEGTQAEHVQHHWVHDALAFRSQTSSVCTGLVGLPMLDIQMRKAT